MSAAASTGSAGDGRPLIRSSTSARVGLSSDRRSSARANSDSDRPSSAARALSRRCRSSGTFRIWRLAMRSTLLHAPCMHTAAVAQPACLDDQLIVHSASLLRCCDSESGASLDSSQLGSGGHPRVPPASRTAAGRFRRSAPDEIRSSPNSSQLGSGTHPKLSPAAQSTATTLPQKRDRRIQASPPSLRIRSTNAVTASGSSRSTSSSIARIASRFAGSRTSSDATSSMNSGVTRSIISRVNST